MLRLNGIARGHKLWHRALYKLAPLMMGSPAPDVVKTLLYRGDFWGNPQNQLLQRVMRGPSEWTPGERELMASFCSRQFQCPF